MTMTPLDLFAMLGIVTGGREFETSLGICIIEDGVEATFG